MSARAMPLLAILILAVLAPSSLAGDSPQAPLSFDLPEQDAEHVWARLFAAQDAAVPGQKLLVGVHLKHEPEWHTYWRNGGDSGEATRIEWQLPEGVTAGPILWPTPYEYVDSIGAVTYGYGDDVALLAELDIPADFEGELQIGAHVEWLMCKSLCIFGEDELALSLPVRDSAQPVAGFDAELIAATQERLPEPNRSLSIQSALELRRVPLEQKTRVITRIGDIADAENAEVTWFPYEGEQIFSEPARIDQRDGEIFLEMPFEVIPGDVVDLLQWGGVLDLKLDGEQHFVEIAIELPLGPADEQPVASGDPLIAAYIGDAQPLLQGGGAAATHSFWRYLLFAFVGGIILNVMPCVLPVLSLKIMGFVSHAGESRAAILQLGLLFTLGVLLSFLALALAVIGIQAAGDQLGWGFQFQNPIFVVVMAAVVFAFGLSLFGVYEIILPFNFGGGAGGGARSQSFVSGILATALATPCTAPFLGTALGFAFTQPWYGILAIFLTVGLGLSLPYILLSANPGWLRFVPKPGAWMEHFKQAMGFLLMATLVWLLWVLSRQLGGEAVIWTLAFLTALGFGLWMYGAFVDLSSGSARRFAFLLLLIAITVGSGYGLLRGPLNEPAPRASAETAHGDWKPFSLASLQAEVSAGNTVFLDFTADWCTTCKVNEKTVLSTDEVEAKMRELGIVKMLGDYTRRDDEITQVLRSFGRSGVPLYVVYPAGRLDAPRLLPEVITTGIVLEALEAAGPSRNLTAMTHNTP